MSFSDWKLVVPEISERSSVPELMTFVRSSFRTEDFDKVERLLIGREENFKMQLKNLRREYEEIKKERESLEEKNGVLKEELKKCRLECDESIQQRINLDIEKDRRIKQLIREKKDAEDRVAHSDSQLMDFDIRVSYLEEAIAKLVSVPVEIIRSGAFPTHERIDVEVSKNGDNHLVHGVQNGNTNTQDLQKGEIKHGDSENGGLSFEKVFEESGSDGQARKSFPNGLPQYGRSSTGTQGPGFLIGETAANGHDNTESSGAQSTFDCPQVESVPSDPKKENDKSSDTDLNDKEMLLTKVRKVDSHYVVLSSCDVQAACDAPQLGTSGFSPGKEKKMPMAEALTKTDSDCDNQTGVQKQLVVETESYSQAAASCIPVSRTPGSHIIVEISDSEEESIPAGSDHVSASCASEFDSIRNKMPFSSSGKSACIVRTEEDNGMVGIKDSRIHLMPKRKRSVTETHDCNFMVARRKTEDRQLLNDEKGSLGKESSGKLNLKSTGCQEPNLPSLLSHLGKVGGSGSLQIASREFVSDDSDDSSNCSSTDSGDETSLESYISRFRSCRQKTWKFAADMLSDFEKDYELCMNAVCTLYRKKISAEKSIKKSSVPADPGFSCYDAMSGTKLAEFLIDGDPQLKLKRTVSDLQDKDPQVLSKCKDFAIQYYEKLFEIYQKGQDPFFHPKF